MGLTSWKRRSSFVPVMAVAFVMFVADRPAAAASQDVLTAARISITIEGREIASFTRLQELTTSAQPGTASADAVTLSRSLTTGTEMNEWQEAVLQGGSGGIRDCALVLYDTDGKPVARYYLENAWPSKIEIGSLKAGSSEVLSESVTIVAEHIQRISV